MPDYRDAKIYKLKSSNTDLCYIGSTIQPLNSRLSLHKYHYKLWKSGNYHFVTSFKVFDDVDCKIELLERYPCDNRNELELRERHYIETIKCVNKNVPTRTMAEYHEINKDAIDAKRKVRHDCDCHGKYTTANKQIHFKTKKHLEYFESL